MRITKEFEIIYTYSLKNDNIDLPQIQEQMEFLREQGFVSYGGKKYKYKKYWIKQEYDGDTVKAIVEVDDVE